MSQTTLYLVPEVKELLVRLAGWESISMSALVRRLLEAEDARIRSQYPRESAGEDGGAVR